jgi:hypothetical protein
VRRLHLSLLLALITAALGSVPTPVAADSSDPLQPVGLRVFGGEGVWHADNYFRLDWDQPSTPPTAVDHRIRDQAGAALTATVRNSEEVGAIDHLRVPAGPGIYTAEVWFEGPHGEEGPHASATLRFDDRPPAAARPLAPPTWIAGNVSAVLKIDHPPGPQPISGIRGYAVSVDRGAGSAPCAGPDRCTMAETDLAGGIDDDTISLGTLPEGINLARVVAVSGSGMRSETVESAPLWVDATPPDVVLSGLPDGWARRPVQLTVKATDALSGMEVAGPAGPFTAIAADGGAPALAAGSSVSTFVAGTGVHTVAFYARDAAGNVADGGSGLARPSTAVVRIDEEGPSVAFAATLDPSDPERIEAVVVDSLSGPSRSHGTIGVRAAGSRAQFEAIPTIVSAGTLIGRWDSDAYPAGSYEFRAVGYDAAGNFTSSERREDGARMVLANPVKAQVTIESGFGGKRMVWHRCARRQGRRRCHAETLDGFDGRPARRSVPYGRGVLFGGRLTTASGSPLSGLPVAVVETFAAGADPVQRVSTVRTGADGTFVIRLAPGPTREVTASFAGDRVLARATGRRTQLQVLASVRLRASASTAVVGGAPVVFSGRIGDLDAPILRTGRPVQLQFRVPGSDWSEFRTVQTDAHGRFRYAYAFSDDDSRGVRFQFRAFAPAQEDWPYEPAASRQVIVTGR